MPDVPDVQAEPEVQVEVVEVPAPKKRGRPKWETKWSIEVGDEMR